MPRRARVAMLAAVALATVGIRLPAVRIPLPGGPVFLGRRSPLIDVITILDVWGDGMFAAGCEDRVVLDLGGHKGYFGAWALAHGATAVVSCEPERENYRMLGRSRAANERQDAWVAEQVAVGRTAGRARLFLSEESWAHSLYGHMVDAASSEEVEVVTLGALLERAGADHPGHEVVLKVNVEGAAGDVLLPVTPDRLASVAEVHLDHEPGSIDPVEVILEHLAAAGLTEVSVRQHRLYRIGRPAVPAPCGHLDR